MTCTIADLPGKLVDALAPKILLRKSATSPIGPSAGPGSSPGPPAVSFVSGEFGSGIEELLLLLLLLFSDFVPTLVVSFECPAAVAVSGELVDREWWWW